MQKSRLFQLPVGAHPGIPASEYNADTDLLRNSYVSAAYKRSPAHAEHERNHPKPPTASMQLGTAFHALTLTPETYDVEALQCPTATRRSEGYRALRDRYPFHAILTADEHQTVSEMRDSVEAKYGDILAAPTEPELTIRWALETQSGRVL